MVISWLYPSYLHDVAAIKPCSAVLDTAGTTVLLAGSALMVLEWWFSPSAIVNHLARSNYMFQLLIYLFNH